MRRGWKRAWMIVPAAAVCVLGVTGGAAVGKRLAGDRPAGEYEFFDEIIDVKHLISKRYVNDVDDRVLREGAIKGMIEALNDPYTVYVPAAETRTFSKDLLGEYVGIGAQINIREGYLTIVSPLEDSPSFRAGLMSDDKVLEINGESTFNIGVDACIEKLMGEPGTKVTLLIERKGQRLTFEIERAKIKTRAVKGVRRSATDPNQWDFTVDAARGIVYIRLTQFTPGCAAEVAAALRSEGVESGGVKGLVLDLRFNPGGLLREAEDIADLFLESGVIVSTKGRAYPEVVRRAEKAGTLPDFPISVLVNGQSASASEVLAGALVENGRAVAVGTRSFGKGSVQQVVSLPRGGGSEVKITEQGYFLPSGRSLTRTDTTSAWGVDPTDGFYIPMSDDETVAMLEVRRAREVLTQQGQVPAEGDRWDDPEWVLSSMKDPQLAGAVHAVQGRIDAGQWPRVGAPGPQAATIAGAEITKLNEYRTRLIREMEKTERRLEALESPEASALATTKDLWDDAIELRGGQVEVRDKDGKVIAVLDITGEGLERWLLDAAVRKKSEPNP
ncbi:MAG: hypothetical protein HBSAPP03_01880 [Phycisphaerae bacterium]|nr:MAG: hypothetical protein HBSAPP03_01880 [Phycisphaerae bacterium]